MSEITTFQHGLQVKPALAKHDVGDSLVSFGISDIQGCRLGCHIDDRSKAMTALQRRPCPVSDGRNNDAEAVRGSTS